MPDDTRIRLRAYNLIDFIASRQATEASRAVAVRELQQIVDNLLEEKP